jgi:hypothetical protein
MTFLFGLGEKIAIGLAADLVKASASKVRKLLSKGEAQKALEAAIAAALDDALTAVDLPEAEQAHYEHVFEEFFRCEAVVDELAPLLDPRPDVELDLEALSRELREAGCDPESIQSFHLDDFLRRFASAFYAAAASQPALRDNLEMKLLGEMVSRMGVVAHASERSAAATERMSALMERFLKNQEEGTALLAAGREALKQGFLPSLDFYEQIAAAMWGAGFDFGVGRKDVIEIGGSTSPAARALPPAQVETLRKLAGDLRRTVLDHEPTAADLAALEKRYRQHLIHWFGNLQFQGLMRTPRPIVLPLEEVYVELRAVAEVPEAADAFSIEERRLFLDVDEKDAAGRRELMSQLDALRRERWSRTLPERKSMAEALHQRDRRAFVILGDPGSGKTTLLHFLALVYARGPETAAARLAVDPTEADRLPIFVPLAAFDDMLREVPGLTLADFLARYYDRRRSLPGLGPLFRRALESGRALVLLDGLDEVLDTGTRSYVAAQAGALIGEWSPRGVRFVVSSRFVGYREAPVPGGLPTLSVLDFGTPEIEVFVHRWARAYETWAANGESPEALRRARTLESDLLTDVQSNESVRRLAANPLMLTMLALLRRQVGKLPHRRVQLYESYVGALLETWVDARTEGARERSVEILDRHQAENILIPLALWLQQEKPSGTTGGAELQWKLQEICLEEAGIVVETASRPQRREAEEKALRFLQEMRQMSGLLVERGHDAFGFLHLTFQEYFAGRALARLGEEERWRTVYPHLHDPRWREPILLCAGRLGVVENRRAQVTGFVRAILDCPDPTEEKLHRSLLLALAIAGDDVNLDPALLANLVQRAVACLPSRIQTLTKSLVGALGQLVANGAAGVGECFGKAWESETAWHRSIAVAALSRFAGVEAIRGVLMERLADAEPWVVAAALEALSSQVALAVTVRRAVMERLDSKTELIRQRSVRALTGLVESDRTARAAVLDRLGDNDLGVQMEAMKALSGVLRIDEEIREAILAKMNIDDSNWMIPRAAVSAVAGMVGADQEIRSAVLAKLDDPDKTVREAAVSALQGICENDQEVLWALLAKLDDPQPNVWESVVRALSGVAEAANEVRRAMLAKVERGSEQDKVAALRSLASFLPSDHEVFSILQKQSTAVDWQARKIVGEILIESVGTIESVDHLLQLRDNCDALESLALLESVAEAAPCRLAGNERWRLYWLDKTRSENAVERAAAVAALKGRIETDREVRRTVLERLSDDAPNVRRSALSAMSGVIRTDAEVRAAALEKLGDEDPYVQGSALGALSGLVGTDAEVRAAALERLGDEEPYVRGLALGALSRVVDTAAEVRAAALERLGDEDLYVRGSALGALSGLVGTDAEVRATALERLENEEPYIQESALSALSRVVGTDAEVRAAVLKRLGEESCEVPEAAVAALASLFGEMPDVTRAIGDRLGDRDFPVRLAAVEAAANSPSQVLDTTLLEQLRPWLSLCVQASTVRAQTAHRVQAKLADLFGPRIPQDPTLREGLLAALRDSRWSARLGAALALLAWPTGPPDDVLDRIFEALEDRRGLEAYPAQLTAASFLINQNAHAQASINLCLEALDYGTRPWEDNGMSWAVRQQAALALGKLDPLFFDERVYGKLLQVMERDQSFAVIDAAYGTLVRLARACDRARLAAA